MDTRDIKILIIGIIFLASIVVLVYFLHNRPTKANLMKRVNSLSGAMRDIGTNQCLYTQTDINNITALMTQISNLSTTVNGANLSPSDKSDLQQQVSTLLASATVESKLPLCSTLCPSDTTTYDQQTNSCVLKYEDAGPYKSSLQGLQTSFTNLQSTLHPYPTQPAQPGGSCLSANFNGDTVVACDESSPANFCVNYATTCGKTDSGSYCDTTKKTCHWKYVGL